MKLVILGAGESGIGAAILGKQKGYDVFVSDFGMISEEIKAFFNEESIAFEEGGHTSAIEDAELVVKSPGIPEKVPVVRKFLEEGTPVISEIEFAYRFLEQEKVIAITGTNGKTTTTLLAYHLLKTAGLKVALGGNIGVSFAKLVAEGGYDYYVVEVSSFQLDGIISFKPDVAVLLNITPDHLDRYDHDFNKYVNSKFRITENLTKDECLIYCSDCEPVNEELAKRKVEACLFAVSASKQENSAAYIDREHLRFDLNFANSGEYHAIPQAEIALIGRHNMINTMAAVLSGLHFDVSIDKILKALKTFKNAPHRLEVVREVNGVRYINDSKATNVDAVSYALDGINQPIIWIAGGTDKGNDYDPIVSIASEKAKKLICIGEDNTPLINAFERKLEIEETTSMKKAIALASELAEEGDVVLLSPACASFDRFKNYEHRGDCFKKAVNALAIKENTKA
ncbi:MAG: UDP-N-acetylmuramoyl-L-alanine--D-glutamate ligase [Cytophagales bacterium]|nr:UDP-N-acetylmuramoyl-L-alanine--D-glutamate ligase [Cytophagales bacterium]